jgi:hypothetical protein
MSGFATCFDRLKFKGHTLKCLAQTKTNVAMDSFPENAGLLTAILLPKKHLTYACISTSLKMRTVSTAGFESV